MSAQMEALILRRIEDLSRDFALLARVVRETHTRLVEPVSDEIATLPDVDSQHASFVAAATARHIAKGQQHG